jgi:superfamily II DNA or RNA helicase
MTSLTRRGYGITKECITVDELQQIRKELTVKPFNTMEVEKNDESSQFPVYLESSKKIYVPKTYGFKTYGVPQENKLDEGYEIDLDFNGVLRSEQEGPVNAFLKACKDPTKRGGIINLPCAGGKCLGRDTPVMMFNGSIKKVQDIKVGEFIMGDDSTPRTVLSTCTGREMMYKVIPLKGDPYIVNESHILSLKWSSNQNTDIKKGDILDISVMDYIKLPKSYHGRGGPLLGYRVPVEFPFKEVDFDPYMIGYWLGNCTKGTKNTSSQDSKVLKCFATKYNLLMNKHIPMLYKCNSREIRLHVLAGIIDSVGHYDGNGYDVSMEEELLIDDVVYLARSLGFACYKTYNKTTYDYKNERRIFIVGKGLEQIPTKVPKNKANPRKAIANALVSRIRIEQLNEDEYFGFEIDGNRRFLLGDFTVTHNTVIALNIISQLNRKSLIIVHKDFLLDQWKERISQFLPKARVGYIKGKVCDVNEKDIIIGSLQSLSMKYYDTSVFEGIGLTVFDEVHRTAAQVFSRVFNKATTLYSLGLSATINRKDGLTKVFKWHIGDIVFKGKKQVSDVNSMKILVKNYFDPNYEYSREYKMFNNKPNMSRMINNICDFVPRTQFIIDCLLDVLRNEPNRKVLILSDRRSHLEMFQTMLKRINIDSGLYYGGLKQEVLQESDKKNILLGTYSYVSEGFDKPGLNTMILASPKSDIIQSVGRILRDKPEDREYRPLVIDIVDKFSIFPNQSRKRIKYYESQNYEIEKERDITNKLVELTGKCYIMDSEK